MKKYTGHHVPSGEDWVILGIDHLNKKVCAAGWPPTIGELKDVIDLQEFGDLTIQEQKYVTDTFGMNFMTGIK